MASTYKRTGSRKGQRNGSRTDSGGTGNRRGGRKSGSKACTGNSNSRKSGSKSGAGSRNGSRKNGTRSSKKSRKSVWNKIRWKRYAAGIAGLLLMVLLACGGYDYYTNGNLDRTIDAVQTAGHWILELPKKAEDLQKWCEVSYRKLTGKQPEPVTLDEIPEYTGEPYVEINDNVPEFTDEERGAEPFESYSELDYLGRCGVAEAMIGVEIMPTEPRGEIGMVKPSGWHTVKYNSIDVKYLYNRCHLIAFELAGENANEKNLITGTRYMNVNGMLHWENMVAKYVKETNDRVLYRVTPVFEGENLVASGVHMEAESIGSKEIRFNIYVFNVQPGIAIDYADGNSWETLE